MDNISNITNTASIHAQAQPANGYPYGHEYAAQPVQSDDVHAFNTELNNGAPTPNAGERASHEQLVDDFHNFLNDGMSTVQENLNMEKDTMLFELIHGDIEQFHNFDPGVGDLDGSGSGIPEPVRVPDREANLESIDTFQRNLTEHFVKNDGQVSSDELEALQALSGFRKEVSQTTYDSSGAPELSPLDVIDTNHALEKALNRDGLNTQADQNFENYRSRFTNIEDMSTPQLLTAEFYREVANRAEPDSPLSREQLEVGLKLRSLEDRGSDVPTEDLLKAQSEVLRAFNPEFYAEFDSVHMGY